MPAPTTTHADTSPADIASDNADAKPKKAAERIAELEAHLAELARQNEELRGAAAKDIGELRERSTKLEGTVSDLLEQTRLAVLLASERQSEQTAEQTAEAQKAADASPPRSIGNMVIDDRMSEAQILAQVRAMRAGKIA